MLFNMCKVLYAEYYSHWPVSLHVFPGDPGHIYSTSCFPYSVFSTGVRLDKSSFINADKTSFLITCFWYKRQHKTSAGNKKFTWGKTRNGLLSTIN